MTIEWKLVKKNLKEIYPHYKNPRRLSKHDFEHLKKSIDKFGVIDKVIINSNGEIIGGHQRLEILRKSNVTEIECWVPSHELTSKDVEELNIRLNKNTGEWDFDVLANQWDENDLLEWGFTEDELNFAQEIIPENEPADDETLEPIKDPVTQRGDLYILGNHRLYCGDSTNPDDVQLLLDSEEPILMVTDPPYGVNYDPEWRMGIKKQYGKKKAARALGKVQNDDEVNWSLAYSLFPGSVAYVWHASLHTYEVYKSLKDAEFEIISNIVWVKQHFALSRGDYHWQHEPCWYAVKKGHPHNWQGSRKESTVWEISNLNSFGKSKDDERTAHSTQKPLECMRRPIKNNTQENEGVYDPFVGSGTTLLACEELNRKCFAMELDPSYCDLIVDRWKRYRKKIGKSDEVIKIEKQDE